MSAPLRSRPRSAPWLAPLRTASAAAVLLGLTGWSTAAQAQVPAPAPAPAPAPPPTAETRVETPKGTVGGQAAASSGATNIDDAKFATAVVPAADVTHATELDINAGGLFNSGNARSMALTAGGRFRLRRKIHEFSTAIIGNYGRASTRTTPSQDTVSNVQGRLRYDVFFHPRISAFAMVTARYDPFLGLQARVRVDPGLAFYILQQAKHRLWGEVGYDFQYDARRVYDTKQDCTIGGALVTNGCYELRVPNVPQGMGARVIDRSLGVHSLRLFGGYVNQLSELVTFTTGLEYIQPLSPLKSSDVDPPKTGEPVVARTRMYVNWDSAVTVQVRKALSFATTFTLRYDNAPLPGIRRLDTITSLSLLYKFF